MGRYLALPILGLSAALTASVVPHVIDVFVALIGSFAPALGGSRGQLSLVMLFVLCWSVHADLTESLIWALVGGLALDLLSALPLGASSIALVLMAFAVNSAARQLLRVRLLFLAAITPLATLFLAAWTLGGLGAAGLQLRYPGLCALDAAADHADQLAGCAAPVRADANLAAPLERRIKCRAAEPVARG